MTCEIWQNKLDPYLDSELPERELAEVESHLHTCTSCAADALGRLQLKRMMQAAAARYSPTPEFRLRIEQSIRAKSRWSFGWIAQLAAATAVLLAIVGAAALWMRHSAREQALTELADLHVTTLASTNPVDVISTDRHTVKPWFAGKLPFTFNLPELAGSPFTLVGGRMVYFEHNPGAELLFALRKHHLSVFIFQENAGVISGNASPTTARRLAFNMETWTESGLRYVVISDASASEVHQLSELLRRA
jgi:anti-sigma factor RsiW